MVETSRKHERNEVNENKLQSPIAILLLRSLLYLSTLVTISSPRAIMADYSSYRPPPWLEEERPLEISHKPLTKPSPPLDIEIVFVAGSDSPTIQSVCEHFAHDFGFYYLCINEYVVELSSSEQHDREAYGIVHPDTLATLLTQTLSDDAVAFFILPILRYKVELEMSRGFTKFLLVGCGQYPRTALKFAQEASRIFHPGSRTGTDTTRRSPSLLPSSRSRASRICHQTPATRRRSQERRCCMGAGCWRSSGRVLRRRCTRISSQRLQSLLGRSRLATLSRRRLELGSRGERSYGTLSFCERI